MNVKWSIPDKECHLNKPMPSKKNVSVKRKDQEETANKWIIVVKNVCYICKTSQVLS